VEKDKGIIQNQRPLTVSPFGSHPLPQGARESEKRNKGENKMEEKIKLDDELIKEAMKITNIQTKAEVIKTALENLIQKESIKEIKNYFGKVDLDIDIEQLRKR
jgi:hypothetical protein